MACIYYRSQGILPFNARVHDGHMRPDIDQKIAEVGPGTLARHACTQMEHRTWWLSKHTPQHTLRRCISALNRCNSPLSLLLHPEMVLMWYIRHVWTKLLIHCKRGMNNSILCLWQFLILLVQVLLRRIRKENLSQPSHFDKVTKMYSLRRQGWWSGPDI